MGIIPIYGSFLTDSWSFAQIYGYVKHMTTPPQKRRIGEVSGFLNSDEHGHIPKIHVYTAFDVNFQWQWLEIGVPRLHSVMAETRSAIYEWVKMREHFWRWGWSWKSSDWQGSSMWLGTTGPRNSHRQVPSVAPREPPPPRPDKRTESRRETETVSCSRADNAPNRRKEEETWSRPPPEPKNPPKAPGA